MRDGYYGRPDSGGVGLNVLIRKNYCSLYETQIRWVFILCPSSLGDPVKIKRIIAGILVGAALLTGTVACKSDADVASENLSKEADSFHILRRIVFYNGITDKYILVIEGYCSLGNDDKPNELSVTCKTGTDGKGNPVFKKHFLGRSDNVTFFEEQIDAAGVSPDHYEVIFKPETIIPQPVVR